MFEIIFLIVLALIWIVFAVVQDLKTREVANWLSFSLIIFALGFRFFYSLFYSDWNFLFQGLIGFGIFLVLGNLFYYGHIFAGGDAKLFIALGAIIPFSAIFLINIKIFIIFLIVFLFSGAIYGLIWSFILAGKNFKGFKKEFSLIFSKYKKYVFVSLILAILFCIFGFLISDLFFYLGILIFISPYLLIYAKSIELCCMVKFVNPKQLREGDWLFENIKIKGKLIKTSWEGLSQKDIILLKQYNKKVKIKQGIPFVPVFLIAFLIFIWFWFWGYFGRIF